MEENKYYTPSIEEFRVGFEYEYTTIGTVEVNPNRFITTPGKTWLKEIVTEDFKFEDIRRSIFFKTIRVKYLDKEDIEGLGFKYSSNYADFPKLGFLEESKVFTDKLQYLLYYDPTNLQCKIERIYNCGTGEDDFLFNGTIKNISELKVLLKQLGI